MIAHLAYEGELDDVQALARALAAAGLRPAAAERKARLFAQAAARLPAATPRLAWWVPGRIEVLGKHTDYAGGRSLLAAVEAGFCLAAVGRDDPTIRVVDAAAGETAAFPLDPDLRPPLGHWSNYPMTVARRLARNFPQARRGAEIAFCSDLPAAAGMSSSSAFVVAVFLALARVNELFDAAPFRRNAPSLLDLAGYLATIENGQSYGELRGDRGVGTFGGSEDHTAILLAQPGRIVQYAYCPVRLEQTLPMPERFVFCIGQSGVVAEKTGAALEKYNAASSAANELVDLWRRATGRRDPTLADALRAERRAAGRLREIVRSTTEDAGQARRLLDRLDHFVEENQRIVPAAAEALKEGDLAAFGRLADQSQQGAERLLGNQTPETSFLARSARRLGAVAASAFGAGFGGSVWALADIETASRFLDRWRARYAAAFPQRAARAAFFLSAAGPPAFQLK